VTSTPTISNYSGSRLTGNLQGMGWMVLASIGFAINNSLIRHLISTGLNPVEIAFFVNTFGVLALTPLFLHHGPTMLYTRQFGFHVLRAVCYLAAMMLMYTALATTPLALVAALNFTIPIITTILAIIFFHEVVQLRRWAAILIGFFGTFIILHPGLEIVELGSLLVLLAACFLSIMTTLAKLVAKTESTLTITAYTRLLLTPITLVVALFFWQWPSWLHLGLLMLAGIVETGSILAYVQAIKVGETNVVMPINFSTLAWASLIGFVIFTEVPSIYTWIGGFMIFGAALYIAYRESHPTRITQITR